MARITYREQQQRRYQALQLIADVVLDDRDAAADLRDRLKRDLAYTALQS